MRIDCTNTGKRYNRDWIFRNFTYQFKKPDLYAITGPNGSGKSTLLQVIAGAVVSSEGKIEYSTNTVNGAVLNKKLEPDEFYNSISIAAPYLDVIEEMTLTEFLHFHQTFKSFLPGVDIKRIIGVMGLEKSAHKQIRYYSSGMKQRVKLAQAIFSDTACLFLDEPCTNLDEPGIDLYNQLIHEHCGNRIVIVSSNDRTEYSFCQTIINMLDYK